MQNAVPGKGSRCSSLVSFRTFWPTPPQTERITARLRRRACSGGRKGGSHGCDQSATCGQQHERQAVGRARVPAKTSCTCLIEHEAVGIEAKFWNQACHQHGDCSLALQGLDLTTVTPAAGQARYRAVTLTLSLLLLLLHWRPAGGSWIYQKGLDSKMRPKRFKAAQKQEDGQPDVRYFKGEAPGSDGHPDPVSSAVLFRGSRRLQQSPRGTP